MHRDPLVEELIEELRDRVAYLERSLERRSVEAERYQQIVAGLTQTNNQLSARVLELEAPTEPTGLAEDASEPAQAPAEDATRVEVTPRTVQTNLAAPRSRGGVECSVAELLLIGFLERSHGPLLTYMSLPDADLLPWSIILTSDFLVIPTGRAPRHDCPWSDRPRAIGV
jgi:hypothetical protein